MRQRGAYVAIETKLVNPQSEENSVENIDCDTEPRQGAAGASRRKLPLWRGKAPQNRGFVEPLPGQVHFHPTGTGVRG